jgi:electron-transferring-flavoprotein dehydrogenase
LLQSIPKLTFPGGALIGCSAGFVNVPKIKGTHTAMKSGMLAAEAAFQSLKDRAATQASVDVPQYQAMLEDSWVWKEMHSVRNYHPSFKAGFLPGLAYSALSGFLLKGREPWTFRCSEPDSVKVGGAARCPRVVSRASVEIGK